MTVSQLAEHLKGMPQDAVVVSQEIKDGGIFWYSDVAVLEAVQMVRLDDPESQWEGYYFEPEQPWPNNVPDKLTEPRSVVVIK